MGTKPTRLNERTIKQMLVVVAVLVVTANAYPNFLRNIPNGNHVKFVGHRWEAVGHVKANGGQGGLNPFGKDFHDAGNTWTKELCFKDSDGDGKTNGEELGDANCIWQKGDPNPEIGQITHPGIPDQLDDDYDEL